MAVSLIEDLKLRSVGTEPIDVAHKYTQDELDLLRERFTNIALMRADREEALAEQVREEKNEIKSMKTEEKKLGVKIRQRLDVITHECYVVPNHEDNTMEYYDQRTAVKVYERPMKPTERQLNITDSYAIAANS